MSDYNVMRHFVIMRPILIIVAGLFIFTQLLAQNPIYYSYDSAGNRTQRDTTSTIVALLPVVDNNGQLALPDIQAAPDGQEDAMMSRWGTPALAARYEFFWRGVTSAPHYLYRIKTKSCYG